MSADRTLFFTPRKIREARRRGEVMRARDLGAAASWFATCAGLGVVLPLVLPDLRALAVASLRAGAAPGMVDVPSWAAAGLDVCLRILVVPLAASWVVVLGSGLLVAGPGLRWRAMAPRLDRFDPVRGLQRLVSTDRWFETGRDLVKLAIMIGAGAILVRSAIAPGLAVVGSGTDGAGVVLHRTLREGAWGVAVCAAAFALVDVAWGRWTWLRKLKMSPREVKQEVRESEGDPALKGRRRRLHREMSEHRMMESVRTATVVVVNPTHVAVALEWDEERMDAPTVVATGREALARRIIREARRAGVPVVRDVALARTLAGLDPGEVIPEDLYEPVAAIVRVLQEGRETP